MKNFGTVAQLDVVSSEDFQSRVDQIVEIAGRRFGYGVPKGAGLDVRVEFLATSKRGDVYMVHVSDRVGRPPQFASGRITQLTDGHEQRVLRED